MWRVPVPHLFSCFFFGGEGCMSLLPQEFSGPQERLRMLELPSLVGGANRKKTINNPSKCLDLDLNQQSCRCDCRRIPTTTLHHWLSLIGRSLCDWTHFAYAGYITEATQKHGSNQGRNPEGHRKDQRKRGGSDLSHWWVWQQWARPTLSSLTGLPRQPERFNRHI